MVFFLGDFFGDFDLEEEARAFLVGILVADLPANSFGLDDSVCLLG